MQVGDKVRFMHQAGEGVITAILKTGMIEVAIDGDFRIQYRHADLVPIAREERMVFGPPKVEAAGARASKIATADAPKAEHGFYLALIPKVDKTVELCLVNNTDYDLPFTIGTERGGTYTGLDANVVLARGTKRYHNLSISEANKWPIVVVQALFHKPNAHQLKKPLMQRLTIDAETLKRPTTTLPLLGVAAHVLALDADFLPKVNPTQVKEVMAKNQVPVAKPTSGIVYAVPDVVDLHIEKLVKDTSPYNADEMLQIQLRTFEDVLSRALASGKPKVTFIHGVGTFVLKRMMELRLKNHKQVKEYKPAPEAKYGRGAMDVYLG